MMSNIFIIETISQSLWFSIMNGNTITNTYNIILGTTNKVHQ